MKVLVTGGSGFIGSRLVKVLVKADYEVRLLSRNSPVSAENSQLEIVQCDLLDNTYDLAKVIDGCSVVFNCVGELHDESLMFKLHVESTKRLVKACRSVASYSKNPIHFVQLSSVGAYGPGKTGISEERVVTEETSTNPVGVYEVTKTLADEIIISSAEANLFSYCILRPSNVYGPSMPNDSLRQLGSVVKKKLFFYIGKPGAISTYIHVDDVVDALFLCGFTSRAKNNIFNVSNDCNQETLISGLAKTLSITEPKTRVPEKIVRLLSSIFSGVKGFPISHSRIDALVSRTTYPNDKIYKILSFKPKRSVEKTIGEIFVENDE